MSVISAGDLRQKLNVEVNNPITGQRGQEKPVWSTATANVPAKIETLSGRKLELARQLVATATHEITIRYLSTLTVGNRFNFNGRLFYIGFIQNVQELNFQQICTCEEQLSGQ